MTDEKSPGEAPKQSDAPKKDAPVPAPGSLPVTQTAKPPSPDEQWELALAFLRRADEAANYLRTLLFAASAGFIIYLLPGLKAGVPVRMLAGHVAATLLAASAIFFLVRSWQFQKEKARSRFLHLRDRNYDAYLLYDSAAASNSRLDWIAFWLLVAAFVCEVGVRYLIAAPGINV